MRDPNRIHEILSRLRSIWDDNPDLRLMQILINAINPETRCPELYYLEDDDLLNMLEFENK
jgi:uncharacterized protein YihD (DUF1040 family)